MQLPVVWHVKEFRVAVPSFVPVEHRYLSISVRASNAASRNICMLPKHLGYMAELTA